MSSIDPRLKYLCERQGSELVELSGTERFALVTDGESDPLVTVLLQFVSDLAPIEKAGFTTRSVAGDVATGEVAISNVDALSKLPEVVRLESSRPLKEELDLAIVDTGADVVHTGPPGRRGSGVIVAIIDSGIDYMHECFRRPDGTSRILRIWDQSLAPQAGEANPAGFNYGVEYDRTAINSAITAPNPQTVVRHQDGPSGHGTHVAGIAAGDGSPAGNGQPAFTYVGVAPEADIIVVRNATQTEALGDSARTLDAVQYIFDTAQTLGRPVVINQSQGDNLGPHDGTSLLERGIDNLLGGAGRAMVKSAGNASDDGIHASGVVGQGATESIRFRIPQNDTSPDTIDIWYDGPDRFDFTLTPPGGAASAVVSPGNTTTLNLPNGNTVFVDSVLNDPNNNDNRIYIQLQRGTAAAIQTGNWSINLTGTTVTSGRFDAWAERGQVIPEFLPPHENPASTISVPGTALEIITAAAYTNRGPGAGDIAFFSSLGPTRDGRRAPTVAAPGHRVLSAEAGTQTYVSKSGTSMSAPHVAGAVALMLQKNPSLTQAQIRQCLESTARSDAQTGVVPNQTWGAGKINIPAAMNCVPAVTGPVRRTLTPPCRPTLIPPCPIRTLRPPCRPTLAPPCPRRTIRPPCPPPTSTPPCALPTARPPCPPATFTPPCPPRTVTPPCPPRTFSPPCPPRTLTPPCPPRTFAPPCPPRTFSPPCPPRTLAPPCPPRTVAPLCPPRTVPPRCPGPRTVPPLCPSPATRPPRCPTPTTRAPVCPTPVTRPPGCPFPPATRMCPRPTVVGCPPPTMVCPRPGPRPFVEHEYADPYAPDGDWYNEAHDPWSGESGAYHDSHCANCLANEVMAQDPYADPYEPDVRDETWSDIGTTPGSDAAGYGEYEDPYGEWWNDGYDYWYGGQG